MDLTIYKTRQVTKRVKYVALEENVWEPGS